MDNPGHDLSHMVEDAVEDNGLNVEREISHSASQQTLTDSSPNANATNYLTEKPEKYAVPDRGANSSGSSTSDEVHMEKIDSRIIKVGDVKDDLRRHGHRSRSRMRDARA